MTINTEITPLPASPELHEQDRLNATYDFVFCKHVPEYAPEIANALRGYDIIAIECSGLDSEEERQQWQSAMSRALAPGVSQDEKDAFSHLMDGHPYRRFFDLLTQGLAASNATVVFLDVLSTETEHASIDEYWDTQRGYIDAIQMGQLSDVVSRLLSLHIYAAKKSFDVREAKMTQQLAALGHSPENIGVMMGYIHTPVYNQISEVAESAQTFIGIDTTQPTRAGEPLLPLYGYVDQAIELLRHGDEIPQALLSRAVFQKYLICELGFGQDRSQQFTEEVSDDVVTEVLINVDSALLKVSTGEHKMLRAIQTRRRVEDIFLEKWPSIYSYGH